jgi:hypothetical protein
MSDPIDVKLTANLERWRQSGHPEAWCVAHGGLRSEADWLALLSDLWWSEYWPMDPAAVRAVMDELSKPWNLERWQQSGQPWQWMVAQNGAWDHEDWLVLTEALRHSEFWPLDLGAVGTVLESLLPRWHNLERWLQSGLPARWVEARQGVWNHADWLGLLETLQRSEFWPLDPATVGQTLEELKRCHHNLIRWQLSGHARRWVDARQGNWGDDAWHSLLAALRQTEFWPMDPAAVARVVETHQREWWSLRRWRDAGLARRWVEVHEGAWNHDDWLRLLASLRATGYWPIDPDALGRLLEETRAEWLSLRRWQASGQPQRWVAERHGTWSESELDSLLESLWQTDYWPLDIRAVQGLLQELARHEAEGEDPALLPMPNQALRRAA